MDSSTCLSIARACASSVSCRPVRRLPEGQWYDQDGDEGSCLLVEGAARLRIEASKPTAHSAKATGSCSQPIAGIVVTWTRAEPPTVWLAIHFR